MSEVWMQGLQFALGNAEQLNRIRDCEPMIPFADAAMDFLKQISEILMEDKVSRRRYPELTAYAFWCRGAHLEEIRRAYRGRVEDRIGKKVSLHFASSNIPLLFAYTLTTGLLAGSACVVRLSGRGSESEDVLLAAMEQAQGKYPEFAGRIICVRYGHEREINDGLSALCDVRILWGSNSAIRQICMSPLGKEAENIVFGARKSAAVLHADTVLRDPDLDLRVKDFYNDTYLNDQNACSSPLILYWLGEKAQVASAKARFFRALDQLLIQKDYPVSGAVAVRKLETALCCAAKYGQVKISQYGNRIVCVDVEAEGAAKDEWKETNLISGEEHAEDHPLWNYTSPGGMFLNLEGERLDRMAPVLTAICQTVSCYGVDPKKVRETLDHAGMDTVDRIVEIGHVLDFATVWDRTDLIMAQTYGKNA